MKILLNILRWISQDEEEKIKKKINIRKWEGDNSFNTKKINQVKTINDW